MTTDTPSVGLGDEPVPEPPAVGVPKVWVAPDPTQMPTIGDPGQFLESNDPLPPTQEGS